MTKRFIKTICICVVLLNFSIQTLAQESVWATIFGGGMKAYEQGNYKEAERLFRSAISEAGKFDIAELSTGQKRIDI